MKTTRPQDSMERPADSRGMELPAVRCRAYPAISVVGVEAIRKAIMAGKIPAMKEQA